MTETRKCLDSTIGAVHTACVDITRTPVLPKAAASSRVTAVVTSPPYFRLRDYKITGQLGMETTVHGWVANLRQVFREVARVLTPTGTCFLNLGDSFSRHPKYGTANKSLVLAPERLLSFRNRLTGYLLFGIKWDG